MERITPGGFSVETQRIMLHRTNLSLTIGAIRVCLLSRPIDVTT